MGLGIGLAHSLSAMLILMAHLGTVYMYVSQNCLFHRGTLVLGLGIGLAHSLSGMLIYMPHFGIGIGYWIGSQFYPVHMSVKIDYL